MNHYYQYYQLNYQPLFTSIHPATSSRCSCRSWSSCCTVAPSNWPQLGPGNGSFSVKRSDQKHNLSWWWIDKCGVYDDHWWLMIYGDIGIIWNIMKRSSSIYVRCMHSIWVKIGSSSNWCHQDMHVAAGKAPNWPNWWSMEMYSLYSWEHQRTTWLVHWIGSRENLQDTTIVYGENQCIYQCIL